MSNCPTCGADMRCTSEHGQWRCHRENGHSGPHQADVGQSPKVLRWGVAMMGCTDPRCIRKPGHELPHRDGMGTSWTPVEEDAK